MVAAPGMPSMSWSSVASDGEAHTADYIYDLLQKVITEVESTGARVAAVLTDNASAQIAAWKKVKENMKTVFGGGCAAHALNLLIGDVFKINEFSTIRDKALKIVRFVRDHYGVLSEFRRLQKRMIKKDDGRHALTMPVATRWYSTHACLRSVLENKEVLEELFMGRFHDELLRRYGATATQKTTLNPVLRLFTDEGESFWADLEELVGLIDPVTIALRELESDKANASSVYERFQWLLTMLRRGQSSQTPRQKLFEKIVAERWKFIHTDAMGIAFMLDPTMRLEKFTGSDLSKAIEQAVDYAEKSKLLEKLAVTREEFHAAVYEFTNKKRGWEVGAYRGVNPSHWWTTHQDDYQLLYELAMRVFAIPPSSAASERAWSIFELIHTKRRNRLSPDRVELLAYVYINAGVLTKASTASENMAQILCHPDSIDDDVSLSSLQACATQAA